MGKKVAIFGAGVAGMTAAHELLERGFEVTLYERRPDYIGGKARSVDVPDSAAPGFEPLPGEHGFRFFPGFYRHLGDTMKRIPLDLNDANKKIKRTAFHNLVESQTVTMARADQAPFSALVHFPHSFRQLKQEITSIMHANLGLTDSDKDKIAEKLWQILTSCQERRSNEYEQISWWEFSEADSQSEAYRKYFADGLTRTLVAAKARQMSAKTGGDILVQLLLLMANPTGEPDRVLNGPTNEAWLDPWMDYLLSMKLDLQKGHIAIGVNYDAQKELVTGVKVKDVKHDKISTVEADYYLFALPVEIMNGLIITNRENDELINQAPTLLGLYNLSKDTDWMNGAQFYLNDGTEFLDHQKGHVIYIDSAWSLTSISQLQFWDKFDVDRHGNGQVKSILSVDISDWEAKGILFDKPACDCTKEEIRKEVWAQLQQSLNVGEVRLKDWEEIGVTWYLDRDIHIKASADASHPDALVLPNNRKLANADLKGITGTVNTEPLLINKANTWGLRPSATTGIPNLFLAGDYVRTFTDLATMEGACEAGRRATNGIIYASGYTGAPLAGIWHLHEPWFLGPIRWWDRYRYNRGMAWRPAFPWLIKVIHFVVTIFRRIFH
ncbi:MAG: FAD-dependent oxidoreductase [Bacteroidia bacterium]